MIKRIKTQNFRGWNADIELLEGVNIFRGLSGSGKSRILKAILTALTNKPQGKSILTRGKEEGEVLIALEDFNGNAIEFHRKITKTAKTWYVINGVEFSAIGKGVPKEIGEIFNVPHWIAFASQHDNEFVVSEKPTEIARMINDLTGLSVGENILKDSRSKIHSLRAQGAQLEKQITALEKEIQEFKGLKNVGKSIKVVTILSKKQENQQHKIKKIHGIRKAIDARKKEISRMLVGAEILRETEDIERWIDDANTIDEKEMVLKKHRESIKRMSGLTSTYNILQIEEIEEWIIKNNVISEKLRMLKNYKKLTEKISSLTSIYDILKIEEIEKGLSDLEVKSDRLKKLKVLWSNMKVIKSQIKSNRIDLKKTESEFLAFEICPLCERKL